MTQSTISQEAGPLTAVIGSMPEAEWGSHMAALEAGFFQSPAVRVALPEGEAVHVMLRRGSVVVGMCAGAAQRCRLGARARHVRFAAPPAVAPGEDMSEALAVVLGALSDNGAVEVEFGSFGAAGELPASGDGQTTSDRIEHRVTLDGSNEELLARFATTHRRHCRRGEREGWSIRQVAAQEATELLFRVQSTAAARATERANPFSTSRLRDGAETAIAELGSDFGMAVLAAEHAGELMAAALVGWGARDAFYLRGGATPQGYKEHASAWLHWQIMGLLRDHGIRRYNLGGTPAAATTADHPQHGLHRFKMHFGAEAIPCRGVRWRLSRFHFQLHSAIQRLTGRG